MAHHLDSMTTDANGAKEGDMWESIDNQTMASLYQQLTIGPDTANGISEFGSSFSQGVAPSTSTGFDPLASQPSLSQLLASANSMTFSYQGLNAPRRQASSNFFGRTFSTQTVIPGSAMELDSQSQLQIPQSNWNPGSGSFSNFESVPNQFGNSAQEFNSQTQSLTPANTQPLNPIPGSEYSAPPPSQASSNGGGSVGALLPGTTAFSRQAEMENSSCPQEFLLQGTRMNSSELDTISRATVKLTQLQTLEQNFRPALEKMKVTQSNCIQVGDLNTANELQEQQNAMFVQIEQAMADLLEVVRTAVLDALTLSNARLLIQSFEYEQHLLELYRQELTRCFQNPNAPLAPHQVPPVISLYIYEQPLPQVVFKEKPIEESYVVWILTGSLDSITTNKEMNASLVTGELPLKVANDMLTNASQPIDSSGAVKKSQFSDLSVNISTRMSSISLKFSTTVSRDQFRASVSTVNSFPFIVITNESQWYEAAGKLLMVDCFTGARNIPWPQFANTLHSHFLKATRQQDTPERPLYLFEFNYMHQRFFDGGDYVNEKQVGTFWVWFGQCLQTIRFKRYINQLWYSGIIFAFMTKEECNSVLNEQPLGTFLIRFSETLPGLFGVAYVSDDPKEKVKHCLIKNEDIGSNKSLAEFLKDKAQFQFCLCTVPNEVGKVRRFSKEVALSQWYSKKKAATTNNPGYIVL